MPFIGTAVRGRAARPAQPAAGLLADQDDVAGLPGRGLDPRGLLTASPITVKSSRPPPPTFRRPPCRSRSRSLSRGRPGTARRRACISSAASSARPRGRAGAPARRRRRAARRRRTCRRGRRRSVMIGTASSNSQLRVSTTSRGSYCSAKAVKSRMSTNIIVTSTSRAPGGAFAEDVLRHLAVQVGAEAPARVVLGPPAVRDVAGDQRQPSLVVGVRIGESDSSASTSRRSCARPASPRGRRAAAGRRGPGGAGAGASEQRRRAADDLPRAVAEQALGTRIPARHDAAPGRHGSGSRPATGDRERNRRRSSSTFSRSVTSRMT